MGMSCVCVRVCGNVGKSNCACERVYSVCMCVNACVRARVRVRQHRRNVIRVCVCVCVPRNLCVRACAGKCMMGDSTHACGYHCAFVSARRVCEGGGRLHL